MPKRVAMIVTSENKLGNTGRPTGLWLEELAAPYFVFREAGYEVHIASPTGGAAPVDEMSMAEPWLSAAGKRFLTDREAQHQLAHCLPLNVLVRSNYAAVYCVGGLGAAWDFPEEPSLRKLVEGLMLDDGVVASVCHGVLGLTGARKLDGTPLLAGRGVTGVSNAEEKLLQVENIVPQLPETVLKDLGAEYTCAGPLEAHVVRDGHLITGQNPASAPLVAQAVIEALNASSVRSRCP